MGVSNSTDEWVGKLALFAGSIPKVNRTAQLRLGGQVKDDVNAAVVAAVGSDMAMGKKRIRVNYRIKGELMTIDSRGPMHWLERGVKPHAIAPKGAGGNRQSRSDFVSAAFGNGPISFGKGRIGVLEFEDGEYRPYARRAGRFKARRTWTKGTARHRFHAKRIWRSAHAQNLKRVF